MNSIDEITKLGIIAVIKKEEKQYFDLSSKFSSTISIITNKLGKISFKDVTTMKIEGQCVDVQSIEPSNNNSVIHYSYWNNPEKEGEETKVDALATDLSLLEKLDLLAILYKYLINNTAIDE